MWMDWNAKQCKMHWTVMCLLHCKAKWNALFCDELQHKVHSAEWCCGEQFEVDPISQHGTVLVPSSPFNFRNWGSAGCCFYFHQAYIPVFWAAPSTSPMAHIKLQLWVLTILAILTNIWPMAPIQLPFQGILGQGNAVQGNIINWAGVHNAA